MPYLQNKISVLIVDDNKEVTNELSSYINTQRDVKVAAVAYNGAEAVKFIQETSPTVVILDMVIACTGRCWCVDEIR